VARTTRTAKAHPRTQSSPADVGCRRLLMIHRRVATRRAALAPMCGRPATSKGLLPLDDVSVNDGPHHHAIFLVPSKGRLRRGVDGELAKEATYLGQHGRLSHIDVRPITDKGDPDPAEVVQVRPLRCDRARCAAHYLRNFTQLPCLWQSLDTSSVRTRRHGPWHIGGHELGGSPCPQPDAAPMSCLRPREADGHGSR
jgi:hypothetical protein